MAAYAALTSLMRIIDQLEHHPYPPISLDKQEVKSLTETVTFLQEFLERYNSPFADSDVADPLEMRIADAAYAAEDVIESYIADIIELSRSTSTRDQEISSGEESCFDGEKDPEENINPNEETISAGSKNQGKRIWVFNSSRGSKKPKNYGKTIKSEVMEIITKKTVVRDQLQRNISASAGYDKEEDPFYGGYSLQKVIEDMDLVKKEVTEITVENVVVQNQLQRNDVVPTSGSGLRSSTGQNSTMVGFDDVILEVMDKLIGQQDDRQIIPIVGMGGSGKTTLARNIYEKPLTKWHFHICAWTTISQEHDAQKILREALGEENKHREDSSVYELGETIHKYLFGRRYLIIMDDMWSIDIWDKIKFFFPNDGNGSRIIITTRLSNLASAVAGSSRSIDMAFLDEDSSWNLFSQTVFGENACPFELEKIGKEIVKSCRGLPLSIVVVGGLLARSERTQEYWEYIGKNLSSIVNLENDGHSLKILRMSYSELPVYLKPCFLYMGVFEEDSEICVSRLVKLWIGEGFLKPISGKSLELVAKQYLKDLLDRNLVLIDKFGSTGNIKYCKIHDLLRDICLREGEKERFYNVFRKYSPEAMTTQRRIVIPRSTSRSTTWQEVRLSGSQYRSSARSFICESNGVEVLPEFRLLRVFSACDDEYSFHRDEYLLEHMLRFVNSRYLAFQSRDMYGLNSSIYLLWNLHTLIVRSYLAFSTAPVEIWKMPQLRHVEIRRGLYLPDPPTPNRDGIVLENLQTLKEIKNFKCSEEMIERIPNIMKLSISYQESAETRYPDYYCLSNLECLKKLESLSILSPTLIGFEQQLTFPQSLKKLRMSVSKCELEDMLLEKIGSLPHLEKLQLKDGYFKGGEWKTAEGQFRSLKYLALEECVVEYWTTESFHFPRLERLFLEGLEELKEIPLEIGEIPTLKSIDLRNCSESIVRSTKTMVEELEDLHGPLPLLVRVMVLDDDELEALQSLATPYFQIV